MKILQKCFAYRDAERLRSVGLYPYFRTLQSGQGPMVRVEGRDVVMLGSNDYLGLTSHPEVKQRSAEAAERYGAGSAGSRLLNGTLELHVELEEALARFFRCEAAVVFATGFQANLGALSSLLERGDVALLDQLDHACIIDGCRLGHGKLWKFRHNDLEDLEAKLRLKSPNAGALIVVDGVFSMEGDVAPLPGLAEIKHRHGAALMVDDAHGIGVLGAHGRGTAEHFDLEDEVDILMGTFSKSLASVGGFIAARREVITWIRHHARSLIFSAALSPPAAAAALTALQLLEREPERCEQVRKLAAYAQRELQLLGFDIGRSVTPILPVRLGDDLCAYRMTSLLFDHGVFVSPVVSPAVPPGNAMIRTSFMATHTREQIDWALEGFAKAGRELAIIP
ncbi:MAG: aminotransferase class I/II-fold pyridoxal phosphate-dependent enzyme [Myxococcota bacterium]